MTTDIAPATKNRILYGGDIVSHPTRTWRLAIEDGPEFFAAGGNGKRTRWRVTRAEVSARWSRGKWSVTVSLEGNSIVGTNKLGAATKTMTSRNTAFDRIPGLQELHDSLAAEYLPNTEIVITENDAPIVTMADEIAHAKWMTLMGLATSDAFIALGPEAELVLKEFRSKIGAGMKKALS